MRTLLVRRSAVSTVVITTGGLLIAAGWGIAQGHSAGLFGAVALAGLCALAFTHRGAFIGIALLAVMNGLPFIDTSQIVIAKYTMQDAAVASLLIVVVLWLFLDSESYRPHQLGQTISRAASLLLLWWLLILARTVVGQHVPILHAAAFDRDFLYFGLSLMLLPRARLTSRDINALLIVLALGVCMFAAGQVATVRTTRWRVSRIAAMVVASPAVTRSVM